MADPQDQPDREANGAATPPAKTPPAKAAKKAPAKKAPAKKAPAKKAPAGSPAPTPPKPPQPPNGEIAAAAKDAAAQAKSTVDGANNPVFANIPQSAPAQSYVPVVVAVALSLLAILLIRQLRRR